MDEEILELVSEYDDLYEVDDAEDEDQLAASFEMDRRPSTGTEDDQLAEDMKVCTKKIIKLFWPYRTKQSRTTI